MYTLVIITINDYIFISKTQLYVLSQQPLCLGGASLCLSSEPPAGKAVTASVGSLRAVGEKPT